MKQHIKNYKNGFTLIELLIAATAVGIISVMSVKMLYSTVLSKARQGSIQTSSQDVQNFLSDISDTVKSAKRINLESSTKLTTEGDTCVGFMLNGNKLEKAKIDTTGCSSTDLTVYKTILNENTVINTFSMTKSDNEIGIDLSGYTTDAFGKHEFSYKTEVLKRTD